MNCYMHKIGNEWIINWSLWSYKPKDNISRVHTKWLPMNKQIKIQTHFFDDSASDPRNFAALCISSLNSWFSQSTSSSILQWPIKVCASCNEKKKHFKLQICPFEEICKLYPGIFEKDWKPFTLYKFLF